MSSKGARSGKPGVGKVLALVDVLGMIEDLGNSYFECAKHRETEITRRAEIQANRDVALQMIEAKRAAVIFYLEQAFKERESNFKILFEVVDKAVESGNTQQLAIAMTSITELAKTSPLKEFLTPEATERALADPNHIFKL